MLFQSKQKFGPQRVNGNYMATNNSAPFIILCNSRNVTASNNTVINEKFPIDKYYAFDTLKLCEVNLKVV